MNNNTRKVFVYGSGSPGCLYDSGPHFTDDQSQESKNGAIDFFSYVFDVISNEEEQNMRDNLLTNGIHYFTDPVSAGASYCEISPHEMSESEYCEYTNNRY